MDLILKTNATEFRADSHFNIHIEGADASLYRRTSGTGWDFVKTLKSSVIDEDVAVNIPKDWKVVFRDRPSMAVVSFALGEVIELELPSEPSEPSVNLITFTVDGYDQTFQAEKGMNWMEFCASGYNTEEWECDTEGSWVWLYDEGDVTWGGGSSFYLMDPITTLASLGEDIIIAGRQYGMFEDKGIGDGGPEW